MSSPDAAEAFFQYDTYEEFRRERLALNHASTLKLWYALPAGLPNTTNELVRRQTHKQQRARLRRMKFFAFYCSLLKKTFLKKKIHSKGKACLKRLMHNSFRPCVVDRLCF